MPNIADHFASEFTTHTVDLMRVGEGIRGDVVSMLQDLADELEGKIRKADIEGIKLTQFKIKKQEALLKQTRSTIQTAYRDVNDHVKDRLADIAEIQHSRTVDTLNSAFNADIVSVTLTQKDLEQLASKSMIQGHPQKDWWAKQSVDLQDKFTAQMRMGVLAGETNDQLVQRIRGKDTGTRRVVEVDGESKVLREFSGGVMSASTRDATALVRTSVQTVSNNVLAATYKENDDVLKGQQWLSTLDDRTTHICISLDHGAWDFEGNPLPDSPVQRPFPGAPPAHWNCRSVLIPITKTWEELAKEAGGEVTAIEEIPQSTRASMDGQVSAKQDYQDWLATKPEEFQKDVLGPGRYDLWKEGKLDLVDLVDQSNNPLTLDELRKRAEKPIEPRGNVIADKMDDIGKQFKPTLDVMEAEVKQHNDAYSKFYEEQKKPLIEQRNNLYQTMFRDKTEGAALTELQAQAEALTQRLVTLEKEGDAIIEKKRAAQSRVFETKVNMRTDAREALKLEAEKQSSFALSLGPVAKSKYKKVFEGGANTAAEFLQGIVSKDVRDNVAVQVNPLRSGQRAHAMGFSIFLSPTDATSVYVHEMGHVLDRGDVLIKTKKFLQERAAADPKGLQSLRKITKNSGYRLDEKAWEDKFRNAYVGKDYSNATEVLSMGLQWLYEDPVAFAAEDRAMFEFIVDLIRGYK